MKIFRNSEDELRIPSFLQTALKDEPYQIFPLAGDASNRRYYRLITDSGSTVLMAWEPFTDTENFPFLSVHRLFKACSVQVPEVLFVEPSSGLFLLEDLGDLTLERKFWEAQDQSLSEPFYQLAIDELLKIHFHTQQAKIHSTAFDVRFDEERLTWEMNYAKEHLLEKMLGLKLSPSQEQVFQKSAQNITQKLAQIEPVICHRDYHSRNLMLKGGLVRVIDFQDARLGPPTYDLVSLLLDSYVNMEEPLKERLTTYYLEGAKSLGHTFHWERFKEQFHLQAVQRCLKACGSFASFFNQNGDRRYLKYLSPTIQRVKAALSETPFASDLENLLEDLGVFESSFEDI